MKEKIIQQGAEAVIIRKGDLVLKRRVKKGYRFPELGENIRKLMTRGEARILERAAKLIPTPRLIKVDEKVKEIDMEFLEGKKLSESLDDLKNWREVSVEIGKNIAKLHDADIIHGDLTTSNMILVDTELDANASDDNIALTRDAVGAANKINKAKHEAKRESAESFKVYFIDFGLGFGNGKIEDKAVDLHLIKQALEAKHFKNWKNFFAEILKGYGISKNFQKVMAQFEKVEKRGRYKAQY